MVHGLTQVDGGRTPYIPGRLTAHHLGLAGLDTLQEVVVLLLLAGLLRPVEEVVLRDGDLEKVEVSSMHVLSSLVIQPDPRKQKTIGEDVIILGVVEENFITHVGVQREFATINHGMNPLRVSECVTHPVVDRGHVAAPEGGVRHGLLDGGVEREGSVLHAGENPPVMSVSEQKVRMKSVSVFWSRAVMFQPALNK